MLISLLATLVMAFSAGICALSDPPLVLEGPSTLELELIGGAIIAVYAVATRAIGRRCARIAGEDFGSELAVTPPQATAVEAAAEQGPSRAA